MLIAFGRRTALSWGSGLELRKLNETFKLASVQKHFMIDSQVLNDRGVVRSGTVAEYQKDPEFARKMTDQPGTGDTIYPETWKYEGYAWGMTIDQNACTGCNACVVACQSENNIAVVGKEQVLEDPRDALDSHRPLLQRQRRRSRDLLPAGALHAVRRCALRAGLSGRGYHARSGRPQQHGVQPLRRHPLLLEQLSLQSAALQLHALHRLGNAKASSCSAIPTSSVRSRGVMEKCTYCIQRISYAKINAEREDRKIHDGEITTACEAACPARAITFGDINDPESRVAKAKKEQLNYGLLAELNTRPRTTYLAELRNPNPEIEG